jgi:hypothetical protein
LALSVNVGLPQAFGNHVGNSSFPTQGREESVMRQFSKSVLTGLVLVALALVGTLCAQTTKGTIAGVVSDAQGLVVPGAAVTAAAVDGGDVRSTTTGPNGEYRIEALTLGKYTVTVKAKGSRKPSCATWWPMHRSSPRTTWN